MGKHAAITSIGIACLVLLFLKFPGARAIIKVYLDKSFEKGMMKMNNFFVGGGKDEELDPEYENLIKKLENYTFDEKCQQGMDLGVGFILYTPYVDLGLIGWEYTVLSGIMPHLVDNMVRYCCPKSNISFGNHFASIRDVEEHFETSKQHLDISFPLYGFKGKESTQFKDAPFIPLVTAPKLVLLVPDKLLKEKNTRTAVLMQTVFNAWPMLVFICVSACLAGLTVWMLDKGQNSEEFPPTFFSGAWEGVWWAFVTMTTVGYGDRSPKSIYARAFCIMWILMGIILISLFTGLVSAALSASATPVFNVPGAQIGAVNGSIEFQVGVGMNADMSAYDSHTGLISELMEGKRLHGALIDNFILSAIKENLEKYALRIEREIDSPVTYGIALRMKGSDQVTKCFQRYTRHYPQKIFEVISAKLSPVKNPTDEVSLEVEAAETLFYNEDGFKILVYTETGILCAAMIIGVLWELFVRNKNSAAYRFISTRGNSRLAKDTYAMSEAAVDESLLNGNDPLKPRDIDMLVNEYDDFHTNWMQRVKSCMDAREEHDAPQNM